MKIKTINDIKDIENKTIIVRVDFNVPMNEKGIIQDDSRIVKALPTIKQLIEKGAKLVLITHLGRPEGQIVENLRVTNIAKHLEKLLKKPILKLDTVLDEKVKKTISKMKKGDIVMLENIRFRGEEEKNDKKFSKELASLGDIFVNDAFATAHRAHASTEGITKFIPSYAGILMEKEIEILGNLLESEPIRPLTFIFGGAKIDTKIGLIKKFIDESDYVLIGGALANTFLFASGYDVGDSLKEEDQQKTAQDTMLEYEKHHEKFILPSDVRVTSEIRENSQTVDLPIQDIMGDMKIVDIGPKTIEQFCKIINQSGTIIWNGPVGVYEFEQFSNGTKHIAECIANLNCISILGGGDTVDAITKLNIPESKFTHVSTGGGATLEFMEGKKLPGIKPLLF